jgi:hypothetical protein
VTRPIATPNGARILSVTEEAALYQETARLVLAEGQFDPDRVAREVARRLGAERNRVARVLRLARYPDYLQAVAERRLGLIAALRAISAAEANC